MAQIEADKFKVMVGDLGPENIAAIATSGHNNQVIALKSSLLKFLSFYRGVSTSRNFLSDV